MKNVLYLLLLLSAFLCFSQDNPIPYSKKGVIEVVPILGYSGAFSAHGLAFGSKKKAVSAVQIGAYTDYYFSNKWSLRSGVLYQKMGTNPTDVLFLRDNYTERTHYISIPLAMSYHFTPKRNWYVNYGLHIGFFTHGKANFNDKKGFVDIKDIANPFQFGATIGMGYVLRISPTLQIVVDNTNVLGLTDTTTKNKGRKNIYYSLNLGVVFTL